MHHRNHPCTPSLATSVPPVSSSALSRNRALQFSLFVPPPYLLILFIPSVWNSRAQTEPGGTQVLQECMQHELGSRAEIKDLGPSCNRRHVRHSLARSWEVRGRGGGKQAGRKGGGSLWVFFFFFLVHKTDLWKSMSGWQSYYRYHPLYVSAEGAALKTFFTFPPEQFLCPEFNFSPRFLESRWFALSD